MIEFKAGDVLKAAEDYIAQGVAEGSQEGLESECLFVAYEDYVTARDA